MSTALHAAYLDEQEWLAPHTKLFSTGAGLFLFKLCYLENVAWWANASHIDCHPGTRSYCSSFYFCFLCFFDWFCLHLYLCEGVRSCGTEITDSWELLMWVLAIELRTSEKSQCILTTESSLQPLTTNFNSSSRVPSALYWPPQAPGMYMLHRHTSRQTQIHVK